MQGREKATSPMGVVARNKQLRKLAEAWIVRVWQERDVEALDELHAADFVDRSPGDRGTDNAAFKRGMSDFFRAFPDFFASVEDVVVDPLSGKVAVRWNATGTHRGSYLGREASGKKVSFTGIELLRFGEDRVLERWGEWDGLGLAAQLSKS
jgi:steroid delta-isomerase-like uncharacterized protein